MKEILPELSCDEERQEFLYNRWLLRYQRQTALDTQELFTKRTLRDAYDSLDEIRMQIDSASRSEKWKDEKTIIIDEAEGAILEALDGSFDVSPDTYAVLRRAGDAAFRIACRSIELTAEQNRVMWKCHKAGHFVEIRKRTLFTQDFSMIADEIGGGFPNALLYEAAVEILAKYSAMGYALFEYDDQLPERYQEELENFRFDGKFPVGLAGKLLDEVLVKDIADGSTQTQWEVDREKILLFLNAAFLANPDDMFLHEYFLKNKKSIYPREF